MEFDEWSKSKYGDEYSGFGIYNMEEAWNESRKQAIDECIEVVKLDYFGVAEQYEQDGINLVDNLVELKK